MLLRSQLLKDGLSLDNEELIDQLIDALRRSARNPNNKINMLVLKKGDSDTADRALAEFHTIKSFFRSEGIELTLIHNNAHEKTGIKFSWGML